MADFKFACPQCKQHIQCDASHVGSQINCPACRQAIIVPSVPPMVAAPDKKIIQIKVATLRKTTLVGLGALLAAGIIAIVIYSVGNSMRTIRSEWSAISGDNGQWSLENGKITGHSITGDSIFASSKEYSDVTFSAMADTTNREASLAFRMQDANNGYLVIFVPSNSERDPAGFIRLFKRVSGNETAIAVYQKQKRKLLGMRHSAKIKVVAHGSIIEVYVNGVKVLHASDSTFATGSIGFRIYGASDYPCDATFSKVTFH